MFEENKIELDSPFDEMEDMIESPDTIENCLTI